MLWNRLRAGREITMQVNVWTRLWKW